MLASRSPFPHASRVIPNSASRAIPNALHLVTARNVCYSPFPALAGTVSPAPMFQLLQGQSAKGKAKSILFFHQLFFPLLTTFIFQPSPDNFKGVPEILAPLQDGHV